MAANAADGVGCKRVLLVRDQIEGDEVRYDESTVRGVVQGVQNKNVWQAFFDSISISSSAHGRDAHGEPVEELHLWAFVSV